MMIDVLLACLADNQYIMAREETMYVTGFERSQLPRTFINT